MAESGAARSGGCLCGAVRYLVSGPLRPLIMCHCTQCRRTTGLTVACHIFVADKGAYYAIEPGVAQFPSHPGPSPKS